MEFHWKALFLVTALLSMTTTLAAADAVNVRLEMSKSPVKVGEQVIFTCYIQGIQVENLVVFNKVIVIEGEIRDINKEQISALTSVSPPYKTLGFKVERTSEGSDLVYKLTIDGVRIDDGGSYSCSVPDANKYSAKLLEVYRVPESIKFVNYNESDVVEVVENQPIQDLICRVSHVMPHPDVMVSVGDRDVTNDFLTTAKTNIKCSNIGSSSKTCPLHSDYDVEVTSREFKPTYTDNGLRLTCSSKMRDFEQNQVSTSLVLDVKYTPKVNCTNPLVIPVNQTAVRLSCTVFSNPIVNSSTWTINKGKANEVTLSVGDRTDEYAVVETFDPNSPTRIELSLIIQPSFTKERFQNTYSFDAVNEMGAQNAQVIVKMQTAGPSGSGVTQLPSAYVSLSSTLLVLTSSILLSRYL
jgi:hypothetical protein